MAGAIAPGQTKTGTLETAGDKDVFAVTLTAGTSYAFAMAPGASGGAPRSSLILHNGSYLSSGSAYGSTAASFSYTPTTTGSYYLSAQGYYSSDTGTYSVSVSGGTATATPRYSDFNGDGRADLPWRNRSTGAFAEWQTTGSGFTQNVVTGSVPMTWGVAGVGDYDGDGLADLIWRNADTGDYTVWQSTGAGFTPNTVVGNVATGWQLAEIGDFNNDGLADLFWRNASTGDFSEWQGTGAGYVRNVVSQWLSTGSSFAENVVTGSLPTDWTTHTPI